MPENTQLATLPKASDQLASFLGIDKGMMIDTIKAQCFKGKRPDEVSDTQLAAFISTASVLKVNPLVPGMLYAYPERNGGITPILGPDGTFKKLDEMVGEGKLGGFECEVTCDKDGKPVSATATIFRKNNEHPAKYTAWFSEWCVTSNPNWQTRPRHMLWVRAIKQAARQVIHGLPMDADEYAIAQMQNVTGTADAPADVPPPAPERPAPPARAKKGAAKVAENAAPAIDVPATPVPSEDTTKAHAAAQALKKEEPAQPAEELPIETSAPEKPKVRAFIGDGETHECVVIVDQSAGLIANIAQADGTKKATPSVKVSAKGGFVGEFYHFGGGEMDGDKVKPLPMWAPGMHVAVKLVGKLNKTSGKVQVRAEKAEPQPTPATEEVE